MTVARSMWDVLAHLPAGYVLTAEIDYKLHVAWSANGVPKQPLTDAQIEAIVGPPLPPVTTLKGERAFPYYGDRIIYG